MGCGLEAMVLALQLAKELVDKPWPTAGIITSDALYRAPWVEKRREADRLEAYNNKLKEFHALAELCAPEKKAETITGPITGWSDLIIDSRPLILEYDPQSNTFRYKN